MAFVDEATGGMQATGQALLRLLREAQKSVCMTLSPDVLSMLVIRVEHAPGGL